MGQWSHLYNTARWRRKSLAQRTKEPLCRYCLAQGRVSEAEVADHVVPHRGDLELFYLGELQSLCATCHSSLKAREEAGNGPRAVGIDGVPIEGWS